jgi:hypothetical protein
LDAEEVILARHMFDFVQVVGGAGILLAGELLASRVGQHREDPGLPFRLAAHTLAGALPSTRPQVQVHDERPLTATELEPGAKKTRMRRTATSGVSRPPIGALWGWAQVALARNATEILVRGTALVLSPHPDDETIGCGLLLAQLAHRGLSTSVALATDGRSGWYSSTPRPTPEGIVEIRHDE